jgi:tetratricopeptide (TPR) repeat protein
MQARLSRDPLDADAAVTLGDALLRQARVTSNGGLANRAEEALNRILAHTPDRYDARRMLAAVYLSEHRFRDAIAEAGRCRLLQPRDAWIDGVLGDAHLELGEYDQAFDDFDRMNARKPTAASYARASYARELQGDRAGAIRLMQLSTEATPASDPESQAWHHAQVGYLLLDAGRMADAGREFRQADYLFPQHPFAIDGLARTTAASGDYAGALSLIAPRLQTAPAPADFAFAGDLLTLLGRSAEAERHYRLAEAAWRSDAPEPTRLARFLAERGRGLQDALRLATATWAERHDIFTADAVAWAAHQLGDRATAERFIAQALRTGTHDRVIAFHAAAIAHAAGDVGRARQLLATAREARAPFSDLIAGQAANRLAAALTSVATR